MPTININGKSYQVKGDDVTVANGRIFVDGQHLDVGKLQSETKITWEGPLANLRVSGSVVCDNVAGDVQAGGSVHCGSVGGKVQAAGSVTYTKVPRKIGKTQAVDTVFLASQEAETGKRNS